MTVSRRSGPKPVVARRNDEAIFFGIAETQEQVRDYATFDGPAASSEDCRVARGLASRNDGGVGGDGIIWVPGT